MSERIGAMLKRWILLQLILAFVIGVPLLVAPGRALTLAGWAPETVPLPESELSVPGVTFMNPVFVRLLGAALLAFAVGCYRGWRSCDPREVGILARLGFTFSALGVLAIAAGRLRSDGPFPAVGWGGLILLLALALGWWILSSRDDQLSAKSSEEGASGT